MKFIVDRASDRKPSLPPVTGATRENGAWTIEINSLEDLLRIIAEERSELIIDSTSITVYDDHVE